MNSLRSPLCVVAVFSACLVVSCNQPVCDTSNGDCPDGGMGGGHAAGGGMNAGGGAAAGGTANGGGAAAGGTADGGGVGNGGGSGGGSSQGGGSGGGSSQGGGSGGGSSQGGGASGGGSSQGGGATGGGVSDGETCATAKTFMVPATGFSTSFVADVSNVRDDSDGSCNAMIKGPELVYRLPMPAQMRVTATASRPAGSIANPVLYLRAGPCGGGSELACSDDPMSPGASETVSYLTATAQDLYLYVEGRGMNAGPIQVSIVVSPANDTCAGAQVIHFLSGIATATGDTSLARNDNVASDTSPTCSASSLSSGQDLVYTYTLAAAHNVDITVTPTGASPTYTPSVYVRKPGACASGDSADEIACNSADATFAGVAHVLIENQQPGTYFIIVDSEDNTSGPFALDLMLSTATPAPANDTCASPTVLSFVGGIATSSGDTTHAHNDNKANDEAPTCSDTAKASGRDVVFSYTLTQAQNVTVTVTPNNMQSMFEPVVYVRGQNACASGHLADEATCDSVGFFSSGTSVSTTALRQGPGTYFIWVDGADDTSGPFTLDVVLSAATAAPSNETCSAPMVLTVGGPAVMGDTRLANDDLSAVKSPPWGTPCQGYPFNGNDLMYQFTASATTTVHAVMTPSASFDGAILLLTPGCGGPACVAYSDWATAGQAETLDITTLQGATYFLVVDASDRSYGNASGAFTLQLH